MPEDIHLYEEEGSDDDTLDEVNGHDEIDGLLAALRVLIGIVASPVVRGCLEEAAEDIEHLAGRDAA